MKITVTARVTTMQITRDIAPPCPAARIPIIAAMMDLF